MIETNEISSDIHSEILETQERFNEIYSRFSEGAGLVTVKDFYQAIIDVNKAKIEHGDLAIEERKIRESEVEKLSLLIKDINNK